MQLQHQPKTFKQKLHAELAVLKLVNKYFWKSKIGPISSSLIPIMFMVIYVIISKGHGKFYFSEGLATYISFGILPLCLITIPQLLVDFKTSIILRKISVSTVRPWKLCIILIGYFFIACIASTLIVIALYSTFLNTKAPVYLDRINPGYLIYSLLNIYISALTFGILLGVIFKKPNLVPIVGFALIMFSAMISGELIPNRVLAGSMAIKIVALFNPMSYSLNLLNNTASTMDPSLISEYVANTSLNNPNTINQLIERLNRLNAEGGNNIFNLSAPFKIFDIWSPPTNKDMVIYESWQKVLNIFMSYVIAIGFNFISIKKFNWTSR